MIATEFTLKMLVLGAHLEEVPIVYSSRQGRSRRRLPKKTPWVIVHALSSFPRLKDEMVRLSELSRHLGNP